MSDSDQSCPVCRNLSSPCIIPWLDLIDQSAKGECQACELLVKGVDAYFDIPFIGSRRPGGESINRSSAERLLRIHLHPSRGALQVGVSWDDKNGLFDQCEFYTEINHQVSPWSGLGAARTVARETKGSFGVLQSWIQQYVGEPGTTRPFLYVSQGESDLYTALSHCWGSSALLRTTRSNINDHKKALPWSSLSQTFQDAIVATQNLEIRYLWIDSMCIIQDDLDDWEVQSRQMATIYSNAKVVLAATDAKDGREGLLSRNLSRPANGPFTIKTKNGNSSKVYVRKVSRHINFRIQYHAGSLASQLEHPLLKRAWAFQEELLATRIVHFTKSELIWECKTALACECMDLDSFDPKSPKLLYHKSLLRTAADEDKFINWHRIVTSYMGKDISFEKDRFPALAGLAAQMQAAGAGQYLAGLWREHLPLDLLWVAYGRRRAVPYKAPTWSWASTVEGSRSKTLSYSTPKKGNYYIDKIRARVIDIEWEASGQELNSIMQRGSLTLAAPMVEVQIIPFNENKSGSQYETQIQYKGLSAPYRPDLDNNGQAGRVFCLLVAEAVLGFYPAVQAIVLQQTAGGSHTYERIGSVIPEGYRPDLGASLYPDRWFKGVEDSIVTII